MRNLTGSFMKEVYRGFNPPKLYFFPLSMPKEYKRINQFLD